MKKLLTILLLSTSVAIYAQKTELRKLSSFDEVALTTSGNVYITQGSTFKVELKAAKDVLEDIETDVRDKKLIIKKKGSGWFDWSDRNDKLEVYITMPEIEGLSVSSSGKIYGQNKFKTDDLGLSVSGSGKIEIDTESEDMDLAISGSGKIEMKGNASNVEVSISGSGDVNADELKALSYKVRISGSGSCKIYAEQSVDARVSGSGSVYYKGNPKNVNSNTSGSGKIRKM